MKQILSLKTFLLAFVLFMFFLGNKANANNVIVENARLENIDDGTSRADVVFDISWENSWRTKDAPHNWDAVWIFVKYKIDEIWYHAYLNQSGLITPSGNTHYIHVPTEKDGAFLTRADYDAGHFSVDNVSLALDFSSAVPAIPRIGCLQEIRVFAIEMVYIPEGEFALGSGGSEDGHFHVGDDVNTPYIIDSEASFTTELGSSTALWSTGGTTGNMAVAEASPSIVPAAYPKGYDEFYLMKYEITQQQYVDFLNTLTYTQQDARINGSPDDAVGTYTNNVNRHKIKIAQSGVNPTEAAVYETDYPDVACNFLSWSDAAAYADWACMRPMTELEHEKAARGFGPTVNNEYMWGNQTILQVTSLSNAGMANEEPGNVSNAVYGNPGSVQGPIRVGAFANPFTSRHGAGASYFGVMELGGNLWEKTVSIGLNSARNFDGTMGDGKLAASGNADVASWPGYDGTEITTAIGMGLRGGSWLANPEGLRISERELSTYSNNTRSNEFGFRAARSIDCNSSVTPIGITGNAPICQGEFATLSVDGGSLGLNANWMWYEGDCGETFVGSGSEVVVSPSTSRAYYLRAEGACNVTDCINALLSVDLQPTAPTAIGGETVICEGGSTTLTRLGGHNGSGAHYEWFAGGCGVGPVLGTGLNITVSPLTTTTYYVRRVGTSGCTTVTDCASVTVTVNTVTCPASVTDVDGNTYPVVRMGCQCWTAVNLKTTRYNDNTAIPNTTNDATWAGTSSGAYAWYDNNMGAYANNYGALYNWYAIETDKLCPTGWHVPTDDEWKELEMFVGMSSTNADTPGWRGTDEGGKLKQTGSVVWTAPNNGATDAYGFSARGGGRRNSDGTFSSNRIIAAFWTSTPFSGNAFHRAMRYTDAKIGRFAVDKNQGQSVRCVRD
jgi:uncharacterized protein (TIGR02145 family)